MPERRWAPVLAAATALCAMAGCQQQRHVLSNWWGNVRYERGWVGYREAGTWLVSTDADERQKGISVLTRKGYKGIPKTLKYVQILARADRSALVRGAAVRAQVHSADQETIDMIVGALRDTDAQVRKEACIVLGVIGNHTVAEPLIKTLESDASSDVRAAAAGALSSCHEKPVALALAKGAGSEDFLVAFSCVEALGKMTGENHGYSTAKWSEWIEGQKDPFARAGQPPPGPKKPKEHVGTVLRRWLVFWKPNPRDVAE
jgi:hypothetical protein